MLGGVLSPILRWVRWAFNSSPKPMTKLYQKFSTLSQAKTPLGDIQSPSTYPETKMTNARLRHPCLFEAEFAHTNLRDSNDPDAIRVTPNIITASPSRAPGPPLHPTQPRQPWFFYPFPNTPTRSRMDLIKIFPVSQTAPLPQLNESTRRDPDADLNDEWRGLPRGNFTAPTSSR
ncbi:hypothetical protein FS837_011147 [Tulasnella sp. UAMH 9824]|nr:hypothetical protein FS837_011147 [Tulasnella sp. UAMH 9824]